MTSMTIGKVAKLADVGVETIRFYEREGLIEEPPRRPSGYRQYPTDTVDHVRFIRRAKALGFTLREIKELMSLRDGGGKRRSKVSQLEGWRRPGLTGAFMYGFIFSLGTSVAPLLLLLTISAAQASPLQGLLLSFTFGLGRGLPFLIAGVVGSAITGFTRLGTWRRTIQVVSGCTLLFVSVYYARVFMALT